MNKLCLIAWIILIADANGQFWPPPANSGPWITIRVLPRAPYDDAYWEVYGGARVNELDSLGLATIGSGRQDYGYFEFSDYIFNRNRWFYMITAWRPSLITEEMVWRQRQIFHSSYWWHHGYCNCDCPGGALDTLYPADAFGFWWDNPIYPDCEWCPLPINEGYMVSAYTVEPWKKLPCPAADNWYGKPGEDPLYFTDSTWVPLADGAVLSGDSKLYVKAELDYDVDSLPLTFYLDSSPSHDTTFNMTYIGGRIWHATLKDSKCLGLKSYNTVYAKTVFPGSDTVTWGLVSLQVALPSILFEVDGEFTDTVFIRSDSMKVAATRAPACDSTPTAHSRGSPPMA